MPSNNFKKWVQAYDRGQAAKNELTQAQNRYKQSNSVTAKASRKLTNAGYKMARSKYLQEQEAIGGGGVGVGGVDQLGNAMGRQSGAVDFRNNLILGRLANADYTGTYSNLRNNQAWLTEQANRLAQQREAGNKGRTAMLKSKAGRFTLGAVEGLGSGLSFGMTDRGGNAIQNWQDQGATNLTDAEALEAQNSGTYKGGRVIGEMASYLVPYGLTHELAGKLAKATKLDKVMTKAVTKIGGKTVTRMAENEAAKTLGKDLSRRLAGRVASGEITEAAAKKSISKVLAKGASKEAVELAEGNIKKRLGTELARDLVQDLTLGNIQDISMAYNRGEKITPGFILKNNLINLGMGGLVDVAPALKGLKNVDADKLLTRTSKKIEKAALDSVGGAVPKEAFDTAQKVQARQTFNDVLTKSNDRAQITKELAAMANSDERAMTEAIRLRYEDEIAKGVTNPDVALLNAQRSMYDDMVSLRPTTEVSAPKAGAAEPKAATVGGSKGLRKANISEWAMYNRKKMGARPQRAEALPAKAAESARAVENKIYTRNLNSEQFWRQMEAQGVTPEAIQLQARTRGRTPQAVLSDYAKVYELNNRRIDTMAERIQAIKDIDSEAKKVLTEPQYEALSDEAMKEFFDVKPEDVKIFNQKLEKIPASQEELEKLQKEYIGKTLVDDDYTTPIVSAKGKDATSVKERMSDWVYGVKKRWFDSGQVFYDFGKKNQDKLIYAYFDNFRNHRNRAESLVGSRDKLIYKFGDKTYECESLGSIFDPIHKAKAADDFNEYMFHRHNIKRMEYEKPIFKENGQWVTPEQSASRVKELEKKWKKKTGHNLMKEQANAIYQLERVLTEMEVDSGLLTRGHADHLWEIYPDYVPTHRDVGKGVSGIGASANNGRVKATVNTKGAVGSDLPLIRLEEQLYGRINQTCQACALNDLGVRLLANVDDPNMIRSVRQIDTKDIIKGFEDDFNALPDDIPLKGIKEDGGKYYFDVSTQSRAYRLEIDKEMFKAIEQELKKPFKIPGLAKANKVFKDLVTTYNPFFGLVRNPVRDILDSFSFSKYGTKSYAQSYGQAIRHMAKGDDVWKMYKTLYGSGESIYDLAKGYKKHSWLRRNTLDRIAQVNGAIENLGRFAAYLDTMKHEGNNADAVIKALNNARDVTVNFSRSGTAGRFLNTNLVPFFNAGMQDIVRIGRAVKEGRLGTLLVGASLLGIAPSVINELIYAGDEDYQRIRQSVKDTYFLIRVGDGRFLRIPKGRVGSVIAMPAQRTTKYATQKSLGKDVSFKDTVFKGMGKTAIEQLGPRNPLTNNLAAPLLEAAYNRSWYGGKIESDYLADKPAGERYDEYTTPYAKLIGKTLHISPKKIDYVLNQYGGIITQFTKYSAPAYRGKNPVIGILESNFITDAVNNNDLGDRYGALVKEATENKNSENATLSDSIYYDYITDVGENAKAHYSVIRDYLGDTDLSGKEKMAKVREEHQAQNREYKNILDHDADMRKYIDKYAKKLDRNDYDSESAYKKDVLTLALVDTYGAAEALTMTDPEKAEKVKASGWNAQGYMKTKSVAGSYSNGMAKSIAAMENGANTYEKVHLVDSQITEGQYKKAQILRRAGISAEKAEELTSESTLKKIDTNRSGQRSKDEIMAFLDGAGYTRQQKAQMWYLYAKSNWANPYA